MDYVDRAYLEIDGKILDCSSIEDTTTDGTAPVTTMNPENRAKGYSGGVQMFTFNATVPIPEGGMPVDLYRLKRDKTRFGAAILQSDGKKTAYVDCRIGDIGRKYTPGEASEFTLDCMALNRTGG